MQISLVSGWRCVSWEMMMVVYRWAARIPYNRPCTSPEWDIPGEECADCGLQALVDHTYCLCSSGRYLLLIAAGFVSTTAEETNDAYLAKLLPAARLPLGGREGTSRLVASVKLQVPVNIESGNTMRVIYCL